MSEHSLYISERVAIFPRSVKGKFRNIKTLILFIAYSVYFLLPWLPWQRGQGPSQSVLFDIIHRRFYIFDLTVYAQDIFWLAGFLIIGAFLLFFITGVLGRVFCGYFCFQTMWTDVFVKIERLVQGERNRRIKLSKQAWSFRKIVLLGTTWMLWFLVSFATGLSFILYWGEAEVVLVDFFTGQAPFPAYATALFITVTTLVMAGLAREQVCTYMCPYARFQGAMFDKDTVVVAYDSIRGERSHGRLKPDKKNISATFRKDEKIGDCIDCGYCIQVCPVGIDIRDGLQYECISCALCVDACNTVMDAAKYPRGLIEYTSEVRTESSNRTKKIAWFKLRNLGYAALILISSISLGYNILHSEKIEMHVKQNRQPLYILLSDGYVQNRYDIKIFNKYTSSKDFVLETSGLDDVRFDVKHGKRFSIRAGGSLVINARVAIIPKSSLQGLANDTQNLMFVLNEVGSENKTVVSAQLFLPK